jgi:hypothetical protein
MSYKRNSSVKLSIIITFFLLLIIFYIKVSTQTIFNEFNDNLDENITNGSFNFCNLIFVGHRRTIIN